MTLRRLPYLSARSGPPPTRAAFTSTPPVTIVGRSLIAPKPFRSPQYRCILGGVYRGGYQSSPPKLWLRHLRRGGTVSSKWGIYPPAYTALLADRVHRDRPYRVFVFSACHSFTGSSARGRLSDSPSGSRERADPLLVRDSTGTNVYWATRGRRGST